MIKERNLAIDMFRGLTMVLMVFVNDFWTVLNVPHFLEHYDIWEDGIGLSDYVFPMFLFAMGMSIPYALDRRMAKGYPLGDTLKHILSRTLALLVMGVFIMNAEEGVAWNKGVYLVIMLAGFFLIWNQYPKDSRWKKPLQWVGAVLLAGLAVAYRSPDGELLHAGWWGILGQIGWMYLFASIAYLLCRNKPWILALLWGVFCFVNLTVTPMREHAVWIGDNILADLSDALQLGNGHSIIMTLGGVLTVLCERYLRKAKWGIALAATAVLAVLALCFHEDWIYSKGLGTLPWCLMVSAVSIALYTLLRMLENRGWTAWFKPLSPAGTATLTVYMIPYFFVAMWIFISPAIPAWLTGWVGVGKCVVYTAVCIGIAWLLTRIGIKLKI